MRLTYLLIAASILVLDQIAKLVVVANFSPDTVVPVIPGLFRLVFVENRGIAFGLFADSSSNLLFGLMILLSSGALALVSFLLWRVHPAGGAAGTGLAFILGGAAGNLVDRVLRGGVVDFLDFYVGSYHWPAFNVADSAIVLGAGCLLLDIFRRRPPKLDFHRASPGDG